MWLEGCLSGNKPGTTWKRVQPEIPALVVRVWFPKRLLLSLLSFAAEPTGEGAKPAFLRASLLA